MNFYISHNISHISSIKFLNPTTPRLISYQLWINGLNYLILFLTENGYI